MLSKSPSCPLCTNGSRLFYTDQFRDYYQCDSCKGVFIESLNFPSSSSEKARYETHNNDVHDPGYQKFVSPITDFVLKHFDHTHHGLDYGAGPGPVIEKVLRDEAYRITTHDPFFKPNEKALSKAYDYIVCCEVMEHFHQPNNEFGFLHSILNPNGSLICMTDLFDEGIDFDKWYYKNDQTHVFFYHRESLEYIKKAFGFRSLIVQGRLIVFGK